MITGIQKSYFVTNKKTVHEKITSLRVNTDFYVSKVTKQI